MDILDIKSSLKNVGMPNLSSLVGKTIIEQNVNTGGITGLELVDILFDMYGNQILSEK